MDMTEEIAYDLNQYYSYYDLVYKDGDDIWKTVNAEVHFGQRVTSHVEIREFYKTYLRGREDWGLEIAIFTVEVNAVPVKFLSLGDIHLDLV